ncbi:hypothetical protein GCK32_004981 [Trichostrongylus colubriformis]|uniref:Uncharacterized protein n=1 Tax=Trichostrongylus colubriformis TaxID=6319 RepID=A0AAN8FY91_TRICO
MSNTMAVTVLLLLLLFLPSAVNITVTLSRIAGTPKYFFEARSLIVCRTKCERENIAAEVEEKGVTSYDYDRGLIRYVGICCARLVTYSRISAKLIFDIENEPVVEQAVGVLEYRVLTDDDDLHEPIWSLSQIVRERTINVSDLKCGYLYQFRLTLITTRIIDRRTSAWISNRHLCRY